MKSPAFVVLVTSNGWLVRVREPLVQFKFEAVPVMELVLSDPPDSA